MTKQYLAIGAVVLLAAFAAGRYSVQAPATKTTTVSNTDAKTDTDKNKHKETTVVTVKEPDGASKTVTTVVEDTVTATHKDSNSNTTVNQTTTPPKLSTLNVSALAGIDVLKPASPIYGVSITKQLLGPVTIGTFGLTNGTFGMSLGINF